MKKTILLVLVFLNFANAQNPITVPSASTNVFTNQNFHNASGIYNASLNNTNFEFLTNTQMLAITTPKVGREVYNTTDSKRYYYNGTSWVAYTTGQISEQAINPVLSKKLTGTTGATQGGTVSIPHGLTASKILGYSAIVEYSTGNTISENYTRTKGYEFYIYSTATNIVIVNRTNKSSNILSKPIRIVVNYEL